MNRKDELIEQVVEAEWLMFQKVNNIGGRASCQDNYPTFRANRMSQSESWSEETLESYLNDLESAEREDRNLLSEKYARMMASTSPMEYQRIEHLLPPPDEAVVSLVEKIIEISLHWEVELAEKYPYVVQRGRPIHTSQDSPYVTSFETYLRGELLTFSEETLRRYHRNAATQRSEGINGSELILESTVKKYGYESLQQANEEHKPKQ